MSWTQTYTHTVLIGIDRLGAALIFNQPDITISSLCWIELFGSQKQRDLLKLAEWQHTLLRVIGERLLERFWPGHCTRARQGDIITSSHTWDLLMESNGNPR